MPYTKEKIISKPNYRVDFFLERNKKLPKRYQAKFEDIRDIDEIVNGNHINKILLIENDKEKYEVVKEKYLQQNKYTIATSQKGFIDINPKNASKGNALMILADHFGYSLDEIVVFGDQDNDVSMLEIAGIGIAMENGSNNAKSVSKFVTKSNNEDGFADWVFKNL
jgi:Cof subfamily protein (haloacid dehalogenase superfamily)